MHLMQTHMTTIRSQAIDPIEAWGDDKDRYNPERQHRFVGHIYQIKFDVWTYSKANLWASLMQTIFLELDRQITLEQQLQNALKEAKISPLNSQSGNIWKALYETSDEDRQWLLGNALSHEVLKKWEQNAKVQNDKDQLWGLFATSQTETLNNLKDIENRLKDQQEALHNRRAKILDNQAQRTIFYATSQTTIALLNKRLGSEFTKDIQTKVIDKLREASQEAQITKGQAVQWVNSIHTDVVSVFEERATNIEFRFIQSFISKNLLLIIFCLFLLVAAIFIPENLAQWGFDCITQAFARFTPLLTIFPIAQGLLKKAHTLYNEVKLGIVEYKQQLEQGIQRQLDIDPKFRKLNFQVQLLQKELETQYAEIPTNVYASIAEFVSNRIQEGGYQDHLGIMHQVKEDLALLSKRLLPPPANSKEYTAKIKDIQKVFPRGPARVILYIDDLDRCPPDAVIQVLEAVQLLVHNPLFIAVLAIDERYINRALAKKYQGVLSLQGRPSAADYLEKIIQIPYRVRPIAEDALRSYLKAQIVIQDSETSGTKFNEFSPQEFNRLVNCCKEVELSPRSLKRLTNVYKLYKVLSRTRGQKPTVEEQTALMVLLAFSGRYPDLMRDILDQIGSIYEENRHHEDKQGKIMTLYEVFQDYVTSQENGNKRSINPNIPKIRHDFEKLIPQDLKLNQIRTVFDFVRSFSFVGDIGVSNDLSDALENLN